MKSKTVWSPLVSHISCQLLLRLALGCALLGLSACGAKKSGDEPAQTPATAAQAARTLDLSTFPLMDGAKPPGQRRVAGLSYLVPGQVKPAFEFQRKKLLGDGWKELPNTSVTDQSASATFQRNGFVVSVTSFPNGQGDVIIMLQNHGNIRPGQLPTPPGVKPIYVGDSTAMYVSEDTVPATAAACRQLLLAQGWAPYGEAGDSVWYKQNGILIIATVSSAPAQGGKTAITYTTEQISADIPAPPDATDLRYTDENQELNFATPASKDAVVDFYRKTLAAAKWEATLDHLIEIDDHDEMIFRNPGKDMLTLVLPTRASPGKLRAFLRFQSAAEIAELDRQIKEQAPALRAAAEAKEKAKAARLAEANKPPPKIPITLPAGAQNVQASGGEIKFTVTHGQAKATAEALQKQFRDAGWKQDMATLDAMAGALSFSRTRQSLTISYTDTGVMPTEITVSSMRGDLEVKE